MQDLVRRKKWEDFMSEFAPLFESDHEKWIRRLEFVYAYVRKYSKLPSDRYKDPEIKKHGQWVS